MGDAELRTHAAVEPTDGRYQERLLGQPDRGDAEREREPERRGSQRVQARIRHQHLLRIERVVRAIAGFGTSPVPVSTALEGLAEGTTYHFRIVAKNAG